VDLVTGLTDFFDHERERQQFRANKKRASAPNSTPSILKIKGSETDVDVFVIIYCQDGTPAASITNPCSGTAFSCSVTALTYPGHGATPLLTTVNAGTATVTVLVNSEFCDFNGQLVCELDLTVPAFKRVNVTARVT
jgi:hypothetical protein